MRQGCSCTQGVNEQPKHVSAKDKQIAENETRLGTLKAIARNRRSFG